MIRPATLPAMSLPTRLAIVARHLTLLCGVIAIVMATPRDAAAEKPRGKKPVATSVRGTSKASSRRTSAARSRSAAARRSSARRGSASSRRARSRRGSQNQTPIVPAVAQASFRSDSADVLRDSIVSVARQQIGTPYIWGAETPGRAFDCSGLVKYVMSWLSVKLPRTANEQAYTGISVGRNLDRMKPGDLLTFGTRRRITHIAIYAGNGKYVHASRPGVGVVESLLDTKATRFRGAVRLVADADTSRSLSGLIP